MALGQELSLSVGFEEAIVQFLPLSLPPDMLGPFHLWTGNAGKVIKAITVKSLLPPPFK